MIYGVFPTCFCEFSRSLAQWDLIQFHFCPAATRYRQIQQIDPQPVADVGGCCDKSRLQQLLCEFNTRLKVQMFPEDTATQKARNKNSVPYVCPGARPSRTGVCFSDRRHVNNQGTIPNVGIAASDGNMVLLRDFEDPFEELSRNITRGGARQTERQKDGDWRCSHARQIA